MTGNMEIPLVSIITCTRNSAATISDTLRSVIAQQYFPLEHIIIDGGSTDSTLKKVEELRPLYKRGKMLHVVSGHDNGIYFGMNKGISIASGSVIGFLNSDDYFSSSHVLGTLINAFHPDTDAVHANLHYISRRKPFRTMRRYRSRFFSRRIMLLGFMPAHPTFYCRRECFSRFGVFDTSMPVAADFDLMLRMIYCGRINTRYVDIDAVTMRTGGASTRGLTSLRTIMRDHLRAYHKNHVPANRFTDSIRYLWKAGELLSALLGSVYTTKQPSEKSILPLQCTNTE